MGQLADILSSKVRAEIFRLLFGADEELHLRELARRAGCSTAAVRQELTRLGKMELVTPRRSGNRLYYRANRNHPLFPDLQSLVEKTVGKPSESRVIREMKETREGLKALGLDEGAGGRVRIPLDEARIADFCRRNHISKLSFFGSVLRDDFTPQSDVDVLVEFAPEAKVGLLRLSALERELSAILGRKADLNTPGFLSRWIRGRVMDEAEVRFVAA